MKLIPERNRLPRLLAFPYLAIAALTALILNLRPDVLQLVMPCQLRKLLGLACPTCGGSTAAVALARLDLLTALRANPLLTVAAGFLALWATYATAATLQPAWRRELVPSAREKVVLRLLGMALIVGTWVYEIWRLRG